MSENLPTKFDPAKWSDKFRDIAAEQRKTERASGAFFSTKSGQLSFQGAPIPGNSMDVVVLESIHERTFYSEKYGQGENTSPACYSFSQTGEDMTPHPEAAAPQSKTCKGCPHDKWKSADNGRGKACREGRRLALLSAADLTDPDKVVGATVGYLRLPVTSVRGFSAYVQAVVGGTDLPLFCSVTRVKVVPDAKTQIKVVFERVASLDSDAIVETVFQRATAEAENIAFPYPRPDMDAEPATPKKSSKKF